MKKHLIFIVFGMVVASLGVQAATIYCVHDDGLNDSQFCLGAPLPNPSAIIPMGPLYPNCDIEALDLDEDGVELLLNLYAASGDDTPRPGHLYLVNKLSGFPLWDLGDIWVVNDTGDPVQNLKEVDAISFHPNSHNLWGWAQDAGLFVINSLPPHPLISPENEIDPQEGCILNEPQVGIIDATLVFPAVNVEMEDITWNRAGTVLYGVENIHDDSVDNHGDLEALWGQPGFDFDFDEGIKLWAYDGTNIVEMCPDLVPQLATLFKDLYGKELPSEIEALEALPEGLLSDSITSMEDLLLLGFHGPDSLVYAVLKTPSLPLMPPLSCDIILIDEIPEAPNDIEGLAFDYF